MQRAIDYLEGELDSLQDAYENSEGNVKDQYGIWEEEVRNAIEYLKKANSEDYNKLSYNHNSKSLSISDVKHCFSFANYLNGWYKYLKSTSEGNIYENVVNKKHLSEMEIYKEWLNK